MMPVIMQAVIVTMGLFAVTLMLGPIELPGDLVQFLKVSAR